MCPPRHNHRKPWRNHANQRPLKTAQRVPQKPSSPRTISTGHLQTSPPFQFQPINLVVYQGPYPLEGGGRVHLEAGFPLRCFQRLSNPDVANLQCPWQDNRYTRGPFTPVLSY